ncbi:MAG: hypothetical protein A3H57_02215 [Candidatus Taylorbacteria bacterium RIFCSPLOWO2_02_FULL_43_11]|uniref:Uncharacterized protein n=1 Tax=Candidatus Taylorbacteria bacterium RIFCSPHIGHO2_02_FULL_43_32b TaxID=1802306 RepID=A0A1G2MG62_9BACT|nr:MAG: hypothetical protein A2743_02345 [Candidatus Taylorbacteria bacterium RIFCSPHIGHO2_01_FULL_43_47]OHA22021.1 MAG: hypothetical protein A3C72_02005 [Candidatus Taylorbacteria bacterium RIFCSPHIGHO2_02_FULL_43_32b]OHA28761.1 MAG: hypothetical protein A3B08_01180 [Candidatus Taylorbacteria bacterium RIFCSPLOWO2_01_FULL_43_44]OHA35492.1 MAG: hypothetical protein A3H57_02215 [Candidatus Taylorbacteria bacterium RIFCSPLOWO2_02_FULL_43_11]
MKKEFVLVLFLFSLVPIVLALGLITIYYYTNVRWLFSSLLVLSVVSNIYISYRNYRSKFNSILWYVLPGIFVVGDILLWITVDSLSRFGF